MLWTHVCLVQKSPLRGRRWINCRTAPGVGFEKDKVPSSTMPTVLSDAGVCMRQDGKTTNGLDKIVAMQAADARKCVTAIYSKIWGSRRKKWQSSVKYVK